MRGLINLIPRIINNTAEYSKSIMIIDSDKLRAACWEDFIESLELLKPNIESLYVALEKEDLDLVSDQLSIVLTKLIESYTKMRLLGILDEIGEDQ